MSNTQQLKRTNAVKLADAINAIQSVPVSDYATELSHRWIKGELTSEEMKSLLVARHLEIVASESKKIKV